MNIKSPGIVLTCTSNASPFTGRDPYSVKVYDPHIRNTFALRDRFNLPVAVTRPHLRYYRDHPPGFALFTVTLWFHYRETQDLFNACADKTRFLWLFNDHRLTLPSCLKAFKDKIEVLGNCSEPADHPFKSWTDVNLNILPMRKPNRETEKRHDVVYCGIYRDNRKEYFKRYLKGEMLLAAPMSARTHFYDLGIRCKICDGSAWSWKPGLETFNQFRYTLYIEDAELHTEKWSYPDLRLYDALICNVVTLFDKSCRGTMERTGWPVPEDFYVENYEQLMAKVKQGESAFRERLQFQKQWVDLALKEQSDVFGKIQKTLSGISPRTEQSPHE